MKKNNLKSKSLERNFKSLIPLSIKKILIKIIVNSFVGKLIKISRIKLNLFGGVFDYSTVTANEAASIFFGVWESAEIRFAKRFAKSKIIIELGSSVGVTLGVLSNTLDNRKFICVEASKKNFKKLIHLKKFLPQRGNEYIFLNKAIAYGVSHVHFEHTSTLGSKIKNDNKKNVQSNIVPTISLNEILNLNLIKGTYTLITDIEGAEAEIFFKDKIALKKCETIIAEIENVSKYTVEKQISELVKLGFEICERYGNVLVMTK